MKLNFSIFEGGFENVVNGLESFLNYLDPNKHRYKGRFIPERKVLSKRNSGFNLNGKSIDSKLSMQNVLINGETGSFKTASSVIRSILTVEGSQIIHDPSKELFEKTSGALAEKGYQILQLDFSSPNTSLRFNPILRVKTKSQITKLAEDLVMIGSNDSSSEASFWNSKAIEVLYILISILKTQELKYQTLYCVAYLLDIMQSSADSELVDKLFAEYANNELFAKYSSVRSQSPNTLSSILSTAQSAIQLFSLDENISEITSSDNIGDLLNIRRSKTAIYLHSSTSKMRYYSKVTSIFLSQYFERLFEELPDEEMLDVFHHFEELPILSINSLDIICANVRKYRGAIMCVCQNAQAQLSAKYGKRAEAILSNLRTKVYLSAGVDTAKQLEQTLGKYQYHDRTDGDKLKSRNLLTVDEIMALPSDRALIHISGMRPILARVKPYFKVKKLRELTQLPPFQSHGITASGEIPLLPLTDMYPNIDQDEAL